MRHVFRCSRPGLGCAIFTVVAGLGLLAATTAGAAIGNGASFSHSGSAGFSGQFDTPAVVIDQSLCPPQAADPTDTICGHFSIDGTVNGTATTTITFNPDNDLDLCITDETGQVVTDVNGDPACSTGTGATESVAVPVTANQHLEAQILPISYPFPGPTPVDPATYTGTVGFAAGGSGGGGGGGTTAGCCHKLEGGGKTASLSTADSHFSVHIDDDRGQNGTTTAKQLKGKVRISSTGCDFRSTSITDVTWDDFNMQATITGMGRYKDGDDDVPFTATADDNGDKHSLIADTFTIDRCTGGGAVVEGGVKYRQDDH